MTTEPDKEEVTEEEVPGLPLRARFGSRTMTALAIGDWGTLWSTAMSSVAVGALFWLRGGPRGALLALLATLGTIALSALLGRRTLVVGADGVWARLLGRHRFFAHRDLESVELAGRRRERLVLRRKDGSRWTIKHLADPETTAEVIRRARAAYDVRGSTTAPAELGRRGDPIDAWITRIEHATTDEAYRAPHVPADALARIAADPTAPPDARVAAALATSLGGTEEDRIKVRVAAEECANGPLREALEEAVEGRLYEPGLLAAERLVRKA